MTQETGNTAPHSNVTAQALGDICWLMSQSPLHKPLTMQDLDWLVTPALMLGQYRIFREGVQPIGAALWAYMTPDAAKILHETGRIDAPNWRMDRDLIQVLQARAAGDTALAPPALVDGRLEAWLVDFICPFATTDNHMIDLCLADLMSNVFKGQTLRMTQTDAETGDKSVRMLEG